MHRGQVILAGLYQRMNAITNASKLLCLLFQILQLSHLYQNKIHRQYLLEIENMIYIYDCLFLHTEIHYKINKIFILYERETFIAQVWDIERVFNS